MQRLKEYKGKKINIFNQDKKNCYICSGTTLRYKKEDKYVEAVTKLYGKDFEKQEGENE